MDRDVVYSLAGLTAEELLETIRGALLLFCVPQGKKVSEEDLFKKYADLVEKI